MKQELFGRWVYVLATAMVGMATSAYAASPPPMNITVDVVVGSGAPGCQETAIGCYDPKHAVVARGGTVTWNNFDSAAHTVTSGNIVDGPDGFFDSSLLL